MIYASEDAGSSAIRDAIDHEIKVLGLERLKSARPGSKDTIITMFHGWNRDEIRMAAGKGKPGIITLYDPGKYHIAPFLDYGHSIYLPFPFTHEEFEKAAIAASLTASAIGSVEDMLVGSSAIMRRLRKTLLKLSLLDCPVHLDGETGTGKSSAARIIHSFGPNKDKELVIADCGMMTDDELARSAFFGHVKGAFTGADHELVGIAARADSSTLFLDEIENLSHSFQSKLLLFLDKGEYRQLGDNRLKKVRYRLITASNIDISELHETKRIRSDFYFRLCNMVIRMPSLSEHKEDIPELIRHFEAEKGIPAHKIINDPSPFIECSWPGNARELFSAVERYHNSAFIYAD